MGNGAAEATPRRPRHERWIVAVLAAIPLIVLAVSVTERLLRIRSGPLALISAFEPFLFLGLVLLVPAVFVRGARPLRIALALAFVVGAMRFGSDWVSLPSGSPPDVRVRVATWNVYFAGATPAADAAVLAGLDADLVSLQELTDAKSAGIDADPGVRARFPYRVLSPRGNLGGIGLLSALPLERVEILDDPPAIEAVVTTEAGPVTIIAAHAAHGDVDTANLASLFASYDTTVRDAELAALHARVMAAIGRAERVILAGDMNTAPTEPAFDDLVAGLLDVHRDAGEGTGWTFRPLVLADWGVGLIAIDHVIVSPDLVPLGTGVVCLPLSDHCRLDAVVGVWRGIPVSGAT